ncbi:hypothetical protein FBQ95_17095 [Chloroflexi bacterium CFX3]|nr:hypothetical protein [Chloroflexi bacterium CFX3]
MTYKIAAGFNNVGSLTDLSPQPACEGIRYAEMDYLPDGTVQPNGYGLAELKYEEGIPEEIYTSLLTQMGLTSVFSAPVTIALPVDARTFANHNAIIVKPNDRRYQLFYRGVVFLVRRITAI